jgi:peptidylprolyl isomerase
MKHLFMSLICLSAGIAAATAQTASAPAKAATTPKGAPPAKATSSASGASSAFKLPPGIPRGRGVIKPAFTLRYQDLKIGSGADALPNKMYKVLYTGWLAADGHKFDSSEDHRQPVMDKDGKPVMGEDGKPKLGDPQPISFMQGFGRIIPGFDQGFEGMKVGGKRRLFIPWQLAYGARGRPGPDPAHPGIPSKADLIFDVELVDVAEIQMPPNHPIANPVHPGMALPPGHMPMNPPPAAQPGAPSSSPQSTSPAGSAPSTSPDAKTGTSAQPTQQPQPQTQ